MDGWKSLAIAKPSVLSASMRGLAVILRMYFRGSRPNVTRYIDKGWDSSCGNKWEIDSCAEISKGAFVRGDLVSRDREIP